MCSAYQSFVATATRRLSLWQILMTTLHCKAVTMRSGRSGHGLTTFSATKIFLLFFALLLEATTALHWPTQRTSAGQSIGAERSEAERAVLPPRVIVHLCDLRLGLRSCFATSRSACIFRLPLTASLRSRDFSARSALVPLLSHKLTLSTKTKA